MKFTIVKVAKFQQKTKQQTIYRFNHIPYNIQFDKNVFQSVFILKQGIILKYNNIYLMFRLINATLIS